MEAVTDEKIATNFRGAVQHKTTEKKQDSDGSVSWQIDVDNLNYLLNNPPSYYAIYHKPTNRHFIENTINIKMFLDGKNPNWVNQGTATYYFANEITDATLGSLRIEIIEAGKVKKDFCQKMHLASNPQGQIPKVEVADGESEQTSTTLKWLAENGYREVEKGNASLILEHFESVSSDDLGPELKLLKSYSFYHSGKLFQAHGELSGVDIAQIEAKPLRELAEMLDIGLSYSIGLIDKNQYWADMKSQQEIVESYLYFYAEMEHLREFSKTSPSPELVEKARLLSQAINQSPYGPTPLSYQAYTTYLEIKIYWLQRRLIDAFPGLGSDAVIVNRTIADLGSTLNEFDPLIDCIKREGREVVLEEALRIFSYLVTSTIGFLDVLFKENAAFVGMRQLQLKKASRYSFEAAQLCEKHGRIEGRLRALIHKLEADWLLGVEERPHETAQSIAAEAEKAFLPMIQAWANDMIREDKPFPQIPNNPLDEG